MFYRWATEPIVIVIVISNSTTVISSMSTDVISYYLVSYLDQMWIVYKNQWSFHDILPRTTFDRNGNRTHTHLWHFWQCISPTTQTNLIPSLNLQVMSSVFNDSSQYQHQNITYSLFSANLSINVTSSTSVQCDTGEWDSITMKTRICY